MYGVSRSVMSTNSTLESTTPSRHLPLELVEQIIDSIKDDMSSMQTSSLVSRSWCLTARPHLFRQVFLYQKPDSTALSLNRFIDLCSHPQSTLHTAGIQVFGIGGVQQEECWALRSFFLWLLSVQGPKKKKTTMASRLFWNLSHLELNQMHNRGSPNLHIRLAWSVFFTYLAQIPEFCNVKALTVTETTLNAVSDLSRIAPLVQLEKLVLGDVWFRGGKDGGLSANRWVPSTLKQLDVSGQKGVHRSQVLAYFATCLVLEELYSFFPLRESTVDLRSFLTKRATVTSHPLRRCIFQLPAPRGHPNLWEEGHPSELGQTYEPHFNAWKDFVCTSRIREIVIQGTISSVDDFFRWIYPLNSDDEPCYGSRVTKIVVTEGEWIVANPRLSWDKLDRVWATHSLFRALKEIQVVFTSLQPSYIGLLLASADGTTTSTPENIHSAMMACRGDGFGLLQQAFPLCSERNLFKIAECGIR